MNGLVVAYRVLAFVVGVLLAFCALVALPLKYLATGTFPFVGSAQAEAKITDSVTGQVLAAAVSKRVGGGNPKDAAQWELGDAENALTYWAQLTTTRLASWTAGGPTS